MKFGKRGLKICKNKRGAAAVEFAIAGLLFFFILFSILDWALLSFINLTMQHAVREGTRYAITGQENLAYQDYDVTDSGTHWLVENRFNAMVEKINSQSMGFFESVLDPIKDNIVVTDVGGNAIQSHHWNVDYDTNGNGVEDGGEGWDAYYPGNAGQIMVVTLNCTWKLLTPFISVFFSNGEYNFTVASTMRTEQFE